MRVRDHAEFETIALLDITALLAERIETLLKVWAFGTDRLQLFIKHPERTGKIRYRRCRRFRDVLRIVGRCCLNLMSPV